MLKNIIGSIIFTAAVFALVNLIGNVMVNPTPVPHTQRTAKSEPASQATPTQAAAGQAATQVATAMTADAALGKKVFRKKCMGCHTIAKGEANRTGPNLWGIIGKDKGASEGYRYSKSMKSAGGVWSEADLTSFTACPRTFIRDTKMTFAGLKKEKDRVNLIAYLKTMKD